MIRFETATESSWSLASVCVPGALLQQQQPRAVGERVQSATAYVTFAQFNAAAAAAAAAAPSVAQLLLWQQSCC